MTTLEETLTKLLLERIEGLERRVAGLEGRKSLDYCGVWRADRKYPCGAACTHDGGLWIAQAETQSRPGNGATAWVLAVKRGDAAPPTRFPTAPRSRGNGYGR